MGESRRITDTQFALSLADARLVQTAYLLESLLADEQVAATITPAVEAIRVAIDTIDKARAS